MLTVLLVVHLMIAVALIGTIMLQRSEGGGLGIGGGGGGFMTGRGTANALTRLTAMLAAGFFVTSIGLTLLARFEHQYRSPVDTIGRPAATAPVTAPATNTASGAATPAPASATPAPAATGKEALPKLESILPADTAPKKQP